MSQPTTRSDAETYRVISVNPAANTRSTTWVRARSRTSAKSYVENLFSGAYVESALVRTPPADAYVENAEVGE